MISSLELIPAVNESFQMPLSALRKPQLAVLPSSLIAEDNKEATFSALSINTFATWHYNISFLLFFFLPSGA
jgi:hypothetical protein